jgi:circadian clock protein KaiC
MTRRGVEHAPIDERDGAKSSDAPRPALTKAPTGIRGLDLVTLGGLPRGRTTLIAGATGSGKTLLAIEFLVRGATDFGEPGLFVAFEETAEELSANVASLGFDLPALAAADLLRLDEVRLEPSERVDVGSYDLDGLFIRLGHAIDGIGAKRVVLDTLEVLFGGLPDPARVRAELGRLFRWLKDKGVTSVVTAEQSGQGYTRHGLEEFVSDCVIVLDHRVDAQMSVRRLRVVKYRGSAHGTDEYPFLIDEDGFWVVPLSSAGLDYEVSTEVVSTGSRDLDAMLSKGGVFRGASVLVSGTAGTGKTSVAASFIRAACERGERCLYFSFEESSSQLLRNLASIGIDLEQWAEDGLLRIEASRPTGFGMEMHLSRMLRLIDSFEPSVVAIDPITTFDVVSDERGIASVMTRLMDMCRQRQITAVFTSLNRGDTPVESTDSMISSVADVWLVVRDVQAQAERNRVLQLLKARGMAHSNQLREFMLTDDGIRLLPVYADQDGVRTGAARTASEARDRLARLAREQELERAEVELELQRARHAASRATLDAELAAAEARFRTLASQAEALAGARQQAVELEVARRKILSADDGAGSEP